MKGCPRSQICGKKMRISRKQVIDSMMTVKVTNDVKKRGVKMAQDYANIMTKDELV